MAQHQTCGSLMTTALRTTVQVHTCKFSQVAALKTVLQVVPVMVGML